MKPELIIGLISIAIYLVGMIFGRTKPNIAKVFKYIALGLMLVAVIVTLFY